MASRFYRIPNVSLSMSVAALVLFFRYTAFLSPSFKLTLIAPADLTVHVCNYAYRLLTNQVQFRTVSTDLLSHNSDVLDYHLLLDESILVDT